MRKYKTGIVEDFKMRYEETHPRQIKIPSSIRRV